MTVASLAADQPISAASLIAATATSRWPPQLKALDSCFVPRFQSPKHLRHSAQEALVSFPVLCAEFPSSLVFPKAHLITCPSCLAPTRNPRPCMTRSWIITSSMSRRMVLFCCISVWNTFMSSIDHLVVANSSCRQTPRSRSDFSSMQSSSAHSIPPHSSNTYIASFRRPEKCWS